MFVMYFYRVSLRVGTVQRKYFRYSSLQPTIAHLSQKLFSIRFSLFASAINTLSNDITQALVLGEEGCLKAE